MSIEGAGTARVWRASHAISVRGRARTNWEGNQMAGKNERHGLVATLATGMKDVPRNASWLLGKAIGNERLVG